MAKSERISMSVIRRLPRYYRFLYDLKENGVVRISSRNCPRGWGHLPNQAGFKLFRRVRPAGYGYVVEQLYAKSGGFSALTY